MSDDEIPNLLTERRPPPRWVRVGMALGAGLVVVWLLRSCSSKETADEAHAKADAVQLVEKNLKAPSTAKFLETRVLASQGNRYLIFVAVDAQNGFGAMLRNRYCVALELSADRKSFSYNTREAVQECSDPPRPVDLRLMMQTNDWDVRELPDWLKK